MGRFAGSAFVGRTLIAAAALIAQPAAAQLQQQIDLCAAMGNAHQIGGCTAAIQSGKWSGKNLAWAFNNRGAAYFLKGDLDRAMADDNEAIRLDPDDAVAFNNRGTVYQAKEDLDRAIADYNETIRLDPTYMFAYKNRGRAYQDKEDYSRAIADYSEAIRLAPDFALAFNGRGSSFSAMGDIDRAIADFDQAIRLSPNYVDAFSNRGLAYQAEGDLERAMADFDRAIRLDPQHVSAFNNRGNAFRAWGTFDRAIADYNEAIRLDPKGPVPYLNRGLAYLYAGALPKARADLKQSCEFDPNYAYAALWLDIVSRRSNLPSRLAEAATQIDMTKWPAPVIRLYLSQITPEALLAAADDADANKRTRQVREANFFIGQLALQRGEKDEAVRRFQLAAGASRKNTTEWADANAELKALGAQP